VRKIGSVGVLLPNLEVRIVTEDGSRDVEDGQPGELWMRGPTVMKVRFACPHPVHSTNFHPKGYLGNKTATAESITPDGWFKTGDIGTRDSEGFYYIVDRRKELIKYKVINDLLTFFRLLC
jgi:long-subunit acyl-CoA synthetase (AMP-forming)